MGELSGGHPDHAGVVHHLLDTVVILVEVHQLHQVVGDLVLVGRLVCKGNGLDLMP